MITIGITGQAGFVGTHLFNTLNLYPDEFKTLPFEDDYFKHPGKLNAWVKDCDAIVHLAAMNRHNDPDELYQTNIELVEKLIHSMKDTNSKAHIIFSSSTQEERDNPYGNSKKKGRESFIQFAKENQSGFTGLIIPNVFGPFGHPYYNSFIATFAHQLTHGEVPEIHVDSDVKLIYVGQLCNYILQHTRKHLDNLNQVFDNLLVPYDFEKKVSVILQLFKDYKNQYFDNGIIPALNDQDEINLFNTFRTYIDHEKRYPVLLQKHTDNRGSFVETIRLNVGGQVSFSTTVPGITRGNHYHTRKIERFTVIKGKARIQLRRIGTDEVLNFDLDGDTPSYVDMPIWYTHNIINTGDEELYTIFWINEFYDENDPDTYFEVV
ncbi:MAG: NAD-dependent epimerase/dehydratase family protein [Bacteroidales bacterium]|nr:NAD-dependent epimerase/dehydratase family protein [Bacteroidales bacterium]